jgi:ADP-heptose:LPS heptosyltransferase
MQVSNKRVLVVRIDHLGDLVLTTPLFRALAQAGCRVEVVCRKSNHSVLTGNPHLSGSYPIEGIAPEFPRNWRMLSTWINQLRPDVVLLPHARPALLPIAVRFGFWGRIITMWGGVTARVLGCQSLRSGLPRKLRHMSDIWLDLARAMRIPPAGLAPEILISNNEIESITRELEKRGLREFVVIHPGCAGNTCNLPAETYLQLAEMLLSQTTMGVVLTGSSTEATEMASCFGKLGSRPNLWNAMGALDLRQLCALISVARTLVCVGTGPLHIASAVRTPTVSPFCNRRGVSAAVWGNIGGQSAILSPPEAHCQSQPHDRHCDFCGFLTAEALFQHFSHYFP